MTPCFRMKFLIKSNVCKPQWSNEVGKDWEGGAMQGGHGPSRRPIWPLFFLVFLKKVDQQIILHNLSFFCGGAWWVAPPPLSECSGSTPVKNCARKLIIDSGVWYSSACFLWWLFCSFFQCSLVRSENPAVYQTSDSCRVSKWTC